MTSSVTREGAVLTSYMKKCEPDAAKLSETSAAEKKLAGAAEASLTRRVSDTVGT